jgi:hypothetical protein
MTYRWTTKDLDDLEAFYRNEVAPTMREDDLDPETDRPSYEWMTEHGFSGCIKALRRDHDLTVRRVDTRQTEMKTPRGTSFSVPSRNQT